MRRNRVHPMLVAAAFALASANAAAQTLRRPADTEARPHRVDAYSYTFSDDVLAAGILGGQLARILVHPIGLRRTLIRPRTQFVIELLKTVETL